MKIRSSILLNLLHKTILFCSSGLRRCLRPQQINCLHVHLSRELHLRDIIKCACVPPATEAASRMRLRGKQFARALKKNTVGFDTSQAGHRQGL